MCLYVFKSPDNLREPPQDSLLYFLFIVLGYIWTHLDLTVSKCQPIVWIEGKNEPQPAGFTSANTVLCAVCLCWKRALHSSSPSLAILPVPLLQNWTTFLTSSLPRIYFITGIVLCICLCWDHEVTESKFWPYAANLSEQHFACQCIDCFPHQFCVLCKLGHAWSY